MALRAIVPRSPSHKHLGYSSVPCPSSVPATLLSPSLSRSSKAIAVLPHFGTDHSLRSCFRMQNDHLHAPTIFPETSNSGSLPGKAGGFPVNLTSRQTPWKRTEARQIRFPLVSRCDKELFRCRARGFAPGMGRPCLIGSPRIRFGLSPWRR